MVRLLLGIAADAYYRHWHHVGHTPVLSLSKLNTFSDLLQSSFYIRYRLRKMALSAGDRKVHMEEIEIPFDMYVWLERHGNPNKIVFSLVEKEMLKHKS